MENVNSKNKKLTIIVGVLLLVVGISFAYFIATTLINGNGSSVVGTTARIKGAEINIEGTLEFNDTDVYPGHKNVSAIKVTATGNNQLIPYNLIWKGESGISQINFTVYKSSAPKTLSTNCERKTGVQNGLQVLSEECTISNLDTLGEAIANGSISKGDTKEILAQDEFITATSDGQTVYYYVVLEYPNLDEDQSNDANAIFNGEVTVEESNKQADINILAVYVADENGNYTETTDIPQSEYSLNSDKSTCSNGAAVRWDYDKKELITSNLTKSGTSCYLYFDEYVPTSEDTLARLGIIPKITTPDFSQAATTDEGVYKVSDGMYGGDSYYWRGAVTNNYVKFANFCWRIVRINGDGSIRIIYDGVSCHANGTGNTSSVINGSPLQYNSGSDKNKSYGGYLYVLNQQRPTSLTSAVDSSIKEQLDIWYRNNIENNLIYSSKIADGKFCNDRNIEDGYDWNNTLSFLYKSSKRIWQNYKPSLNCNLEDIYTLKVGAITLDEAMFAGGKGSENQSFYLNSNIDYWTMTPISWDSSNGTYVGKIQNNGALNSERNTVYLWARPVINLNAEVTFSSGNGTIDTPYIVAD